MKEKLDILKELLGNRAEISDFELNTKISGDVEVYQFFIELNSHMRCNTKYYYDKEAAFMKVITAVKAYVLTKDKHNV